MCVCVCVVCVCVCVCACVCLCVYFCECVCFLSLFIHPGEMRRKFYYTRSHDTPKWLWTMVDKCMEELSSDFPAGCKNELEIESSLRQKPSKLTVVFTNYSCQSTCRSVLSNVHLKPGRFISLHVYSSCSFSQNMQCVLCSWHMPVALAVPSCSFCCSAGS